MTCFIKKNGWKEKDVYRTQMRNGILGGKNFYLFLWAIGTSKSDGTIVGVDFDV